MKVQFSEKIYDWRTGIYRPYKQYEVEAETEEDCFKKVWCNYERGLRYCNDYRLFFNDQEQYDRYLKWKQYGVTFSMFYGGGTVD